MLMLIPLSPDIDIDMLIVLLVPINKSNWKSKRRNVITQHPPVPAHRPGEHHRHHGLHPSHRRPLPLSTGRRPRDAELQRLRLSHREPSLRQKSALRPGPAQRLAQSRQAAVWAHQDDFQAVCREECGGYLDGEWCAFGECWFYYLEVGRCINCLIQLWQQVLWYRDFFSFSSSFLNIHLTNDFTATGISTTSATPRHSPRQQPSSSDQGCQPPNCLHIQQTRTARC